MATTQLRAVPAPEPSPPAPRILFVLWDGVRMLDIAGPLEVLGVPPGAYRTRFGRPAVYVDRNLERA